MIEIIVNLPNDRYVPGTLVIKNTKGKQILSVEALGRSFPNKNYPDNLERDPLKQGGDTPLGGYEVTGFRETPKDDKSQRSFGPNGKLDLKPTSGQALDAAKVRFGIQIHGGAPNSNGNLRPTYGCVRVSDASMLLILQTLAQAEATEAMCIIKTVSVVGSATSGGEPGELETDPPDYSTRSFSLSALKFLIPKQPIIPKPSLTPIEANPMPLKPGEKPGRPLPRPKGPGGLGPISPSPPPSPSPSPSPSPPFPEPPEPKPNPNPNPPPTPVGPPPPPEPNPIPDPPIPRPLGLRYFLKRLREFWSKPSRKNR